MPLLVLSKEGANVTTGLPNCVCKAQLQQDVNSTTYSVYVGLLNGSTGHRGTGDAGSRDFTCGDQVRGGPREVLTVIYDDSYINVTRYASSSYTQGTLKRRVHVHVVKQWGVSNGKR